MTDEEKGYIVAEVYKMYKNRYCKQEDIAKKLNIKENLVRQITQKIGYHHTIDSKEGQRLYFKIDDFRDLSW